MKRAGAAIPIVLAVFLAACASPAPEPERSPERRIHVVRRGETVWRISRWYGTTVRAIAHANRLEDPTQIRVGQLLIIPPGTSRLVPDSDRAWTRSHPDGRSAPRRFVWPVEGLVTSGFGMRNGAHHDGLDIPARTGTPIRAAEAGRVIHSDAKLSGYGNMIILKHTGAFSTVYAHNRRNLVKVGEFVEKGQIIGEVGRTGRTTSPHLHFEVRRNGRPRDPLQYLQ